MENERIDPVESEYAKVRAALERYEPPEEQVAAAEMAMWALDWTDNKTKTYKEHARVALAAAHAVEVADVS